MSDKNAPAIENWLGSLGIRSQEGRFYLTTDSQTRDVDRKEKSLVVTISTRARDRLGDILDPEGVQVENYRKNPVVLWAHDYRRPPIAKSLWVKVDREKIVAKAKFASTALSEEVFSLYADGYLNAWSVGFIPENYTTLKGEDGRFEGYRIARWELLEYSAVPIPTNPAALTNAIEKGLIKSEKLVQDFSFLERDGSRRQAQLILPAFSSPGNSGGERRPQRPSHRLSRLKPLDYEKVAAGLMNRFADDIASMVEAAFRKRRGRLS